MHEAAFRYVAEAVQRFGPFGEVVEFGSRNINGSVRRLFGPCAYTGVDVTPGPGVDLVADAGEWRGGPVDCVVSCEVFEHAQRWPDMVDSAFAGLRDGGVLIVTCAGPGRAPHSGMDGGPLRRNEFYGNVSPAELADALEGAGFGWAEVEHVGDDVRAVARKVTSYGR